MKGTMVTIPPAGPITTEPVTAARSLADESAQLLKLQRAVGGYIEAVPYFTTFEAAGMLMSCVAFCNEDGKRLQLPYNERANAMWLMAMQRAAQVTPFPDYLVGTIVILFGDDAYMRSLMTDTDEEEM